MRNRPFLADRLPANLTGLWLVLGGWPRKVLAATLLLVGVVLLFSAPKAGTQQSRSEMLVVAVRSLPAGTSVAKADVGARAWPTDLVPDGAIRTVADVIGKPLAGAVSAGEPLTSARLLDTSISAALVPGQVAVSVTLRDAGQTAILQAGARIDLYIAAPPTDSSAGRTASAVASDVAILAVLPGAKTSQNWTASATDASSTNSSSIVIACDRQTAAQLAQASGGQFLASLRPQ